MMVMMMVVDNLSAADHALREFVQQARRERRRAEVFSRPRDVRGRRRS